MSMIFLVFRVSISQLCLLTWRMQGGHLRLFCFWSGASFWAVPGRKSLSKSIGYEDLGCETCDMCNFFRGSWSTCPLRKVDRCANFHIYLFLDFYRNFYLHFLRFWNWLSWFCCKASKLYLNHPKSRKSFQVGVLQCASMCSQEAPWAVAAINELIKRLRNLKLFPASKGPKGD